MNVIACIAANAKGGATRERMRAFGRLPSDVEDVEASPPSIVKLFGIDLLIAGLVSDANAIITHFMASTAVAIPMPCSRSSAHWNVSIGFSLEHAYWPKMPIPFFHVSVA
jgi:hypothetical protein